MIWLQALATWPAPASPMRVMDLPMASNSGCTRAQASASPPTMMVSVPAIAPGSPPDTGASSASTPRADRRAAIDCAAAGAIVLMSMWMWPGAAPSATPSGPSVTCSTSGASGHHADRDRRAPRDLGRTRAVARAGLEQRLHRFAPAAPHLHAMARLQQVERHGPAHEAEPDESDIHSSSLHGIACLAAGAAHEHTGRAARSSP
jgi:hypothetical protein